MDPTFAACLTKEQAVKLTTWLARLKRYAADAFDKCGPAPARGGVP